jgi:hypothetical protein
VGLHRRKHAVFQHCHMREQVEALNDHIDILSDLRDIVASRGQFHTIDRNGAGFHEFQLVDGADQSRLPRSGRAADNNASTVEL